MVGENDTALEALDLFERNTRADYGRLAGEDQYILISFMNESLMMDIASSNGCLTFIMGEYFDSTNIR